MTGANTAKTWIKMRRLGKLENKRHTDSYGLYQK